MCTPPCATPSAWSGLRPDASLAYRLVQGEGITVQGEGIAVQGEGIAFVSSFVLNTLFLWPA